MRLTVLGSSASYAAPGRACAGHLVETDEVKVLFDIGHGVLSNLGTLMNPVEIDAIFITHYHPDHYVDIYGLQSMLRYDPAGPAKPIDVHLPRGLEARMKCLLSDRGITEFDKAFNFHLLEDGIDVIVGDLAVTPVLVEHANEESFGLRATSDGAVLFYTADTAPSDSINEAVAGADFLLAEATLAEQYSGCAPHLTATEAGELARTAGASQLAMIHIWATNDRGETARQASAAFGRPAVVASEFDTFEIPAKVQATSRG